MARQRREDVAVQKPRNFIRSWRLYRKLSLRELGDRTGMSHVSIGRIERGLQEWNETTISLLAKALNTDVGSLLGREPEQTEGIWSVWADLTEDERRQLVELARALKIARPRS